MLKQLPKAELKGMLMAAASQSYMYNLSIKQVQRNKHEFQIVFRIATLERTSAGPSEAVGSGLPMPSVRSSALIPGTTKNRWNLRGAMLVCSQDKMGEDKAILLPIAEEGVKTGSSAT